MELFFVFIYFVFGILSLILFFKVWGMCNNVSRIRELMEMEISKGFTPHSETEKASKTFAVGDKVVILKTGKVTTVTEVKDGKYECASNNGNFYDGVFSQSELNKF